MYEAIFMTAAWITGILTGAWVMSCRCKDSLSDAVETIKINEEIVKIYEEKSNEDTETFDRYINIMINENIMLRQKLKKLELGGK